MILPDTKRISDREKIITLAKLMNEPYYQNKDSVVAFKQIFHLSTDGNEEFISDIKEI